MAMFMLPVLLYIDLLNEKKKHLYTMKNILQKCTDLKKIKQKFKDIKVYEK
jgi:hypothetical protein